MDWRPGTSLRCRRRAASESQADDAARADSQRSRAFHGDIRLARPALLALEGRLRESDVQGWIPGGAVVPARALVLSTALDLRCMVPLPVEHRTDRRRHRI